MMVRKVISSNFINLMRYKSVHNAYFLSITGNQSPSLPFMLVNGNLASRKVHTLAKTKSRIRTDCEGGGEMGNTEIPGAGNHHSQLQEILLIA